MVFYQIEYLVRGTILPLSYPEHRYSDHLLVQKSWPKDGISYATGEDYLGYSLVFVAVEEEGPRKFSKADDYLTLFLHLSSLQTGNTYDVHQGIGTRLKNVEDLGKRRTGFPSFQMTNQLNDPFPDHVLYVERQMKEYQELEAEATEIVHSEIGLALQFYHDGLKSNVMRRPDLAIVHFMMAAEALVIIGNKEVTRNVSRRLAALYYSTDELEEGVRSMKKLYGLRSGIVHGGGKKPSPLEVRTLFRVIRQALRDRIQFRHLEKEMYVSRIDKMIG